MEFRDPALPPDSAIRRCPGCSGLWLNTASIRSYSRHRRKAAPAGEDRSGPPPSTDAPVLDAAGRPRKELDAATLLPREVPDAARLDAGPIEPREFAVDLGFLAVQALLRLVFKI